MILARGVVLRPGDIPVNGARVYLEVRDSDTGFSFSQTVVTAADGSFEAWVPNRPLRLTIDPEGDLPGLREEDFLFPADEIYRFVLEGFACSGSLRPFDNAELLSWINIKFSTHVARLNGEEVTVKVSGGLNETGHFQVYLPQPANYEVGLYEYSDDVSITYSWPDSVRVEPGETIVLENPLVFYRAELLLGGMPLPDDASGRVWIEVRGTSSDNRNYIRMLVDGDGSTRSFELSALRGERLLKISSSWSLQRIIPQRYQVAPLAGGEEFSFELGLYRLDIQVEDPEGMPVANARVFAMNQDLVADAAQTSGLDGHVWFRANPGNYWIQVYRDEYFNRAQVVSVNADTTVTITLEPYPPEGADAP